MKYLSKSLVLLGFVVGIVCIAYPLVLWGIGQTVFPEQANGSILYGPDGKPVGSRLIAQPFTKDEYFQPRPSACAFNAAASSSSALAASNWRKISFCTLVSLHGVSTKISTKRSPAKPLPRKTGMPCYSWEMALFKLPARISRR